jgi:hypothetical protein
MIRRIESVKKFTQLTKIVISGLHSSKARVFSTFRCPEAGAANLNRTFYGISKRSSKRNGH